MKRDTFSSDKTPYQPRDPKIEAAKFLSNVARRYSNERATVSDVERDIEEWHKAFVGYVKDADAVKEPDLIDEILNKRFPLISRQPDKKNK